jgi:EAL domain-containing protein (putative c-di-GMP-specific phosphodiesterase class I)
VRRALVSGLAYFASETGSRLIAEGIETQAELQVLRELGVKLGQGFLLGPPMPVRDSP